MQNAIVYLIGFSGTGKLTIARAIRELVPAAIIDNQLINDPVFTAIEADGKTPIPLGVWEQAIQIREAVLNTVKYYGKPNSNFIFTNELFERNSGDNKLYEAVKSVADYRKSLFVPIHLTCDKDELLRRVVQEDRRQKRKCIDAESVAHSVDKFSLLKPKDTNALQLDVTTLTPKQAAEIIVQHVAILFGGANA